MRTIQRIADGLLSRIVPRTEASADYYQYRCVTSPCPSNSALWTNQRRYCRNSACYPYENYGCCRP